MTRLWLTVNRHEHTGSKAQRLNDNVIKLVNFVKERSNPFIIEAPGLKLHNFITKQLVEDEVAQCLLLKKENADRLITIFRKERFISKSKKLSSTIKRRNLPTMDTKTQLASSSTGSTIDDKEIASAQRDIEILKERGLELTEILSHDLIPKSILFDGDLPTKSDKSLMIKTLEIYLKPEDMIFSGGECTVILDFM